MSLLSTLTVRYIIRQHGGSPAGTNRPVSCQGDERSVKFYYRGNDRLVAALKQACGSENVAMPVRVNTDFEQAVVVKCRIG